MVSVFHPVMLTMEDVLQMKCVSLKNMASSVLSHHMVMCKTEYLIVYCMVRISVASFVMVGTSYYYV